MRSLPGHPIAWLCDSRMLGAGRGCGGSLDSGAGASHSCLGWRWMWPQFTPHFSSLGHHKPPPLGWENCHGVAPQAFVWSESGAGMASALPWAWSSGCQDGPKVLRCSPAEKGLLGEHKFPSPSKQIPLSQQTKQACLTNPRQTKQT